MDKLLTRDQFREAVFKRDGHKCVFCGVPADDAHHILERRLWPDGGYYISNGASVCEPCHMKCESTEYSVEDVRLACGITKPIIPPHLYDDLVYDKWGNPFLENGQRTKGELFHDESVQKVLKPYLKQFTHYVKYPRTWHLPWSPGVTKDDRVIPSTDIFGDDIIITEKMDGENTTMYCDHIHARSLDSAHHESQAWVKQFWAQRMAGIPEGWRICGENLFAEHSIPYTDLRSYFLGFSVWTNKNQCLSWDDSCEWFELLDILPVPVLYRGEYTDQIRDMSDMLDLNKQEGYVVRNAGGFHYKDFRFNVAKYVRKGHVLTVKHHWRAQQVRPNKLR